MQEFASWLYYSWKTVVHPSFWVDTIVPPNPNNKPILICLHGFMHNPSLFQSEPWIEALKFKYEVVLYPLPTLHYNVLEMAGHLQKFIQTYVNREFSIIGHSMGGIVALSHQVTYGWKAAHVICVASPLFGSKIPLAPRDLLPDSTTLKRIQQFMPANAPVKFITAENDAINLEFPCSVPVTQIAETGHLSIMQHPVTHSVIRDFLSFG